MDASDSIHEHRMLKQTRSALHRIRKGLEIEQHQTNNTPAAASPGSQAARLPTPGLPYPYKMDRQLQEKRRKQCNFPLPLPLPLPLPTSHFPLPTSHFHFPLPTSTSHFPKSHTGFALFRTGFAFFIAAIYRLTNITRLHKINDKCIPYTEAINQTIVFLLMQGKDARQLLPVQNNLARLAAGHHLEGHGIIIRRKMVGNDRFDHQTGL